MLDPAPPPYDELEKIPEEVEEDRPSDIHQPSATVPVHPPPPAVFYQTTPQPTVILQPAQLHPPIVTHPLNVIVVHSPKQAPCYKPYVEFCPYCNKSVITVVSYQWSIITWILCLTSILIFCWPLIFVICCNCSKDARHYCPCCSRLLAEKRR